MTLTPQDNSCFRQEPSPQTLCGLFKKIGRSSRAKLNVAGIALLALIVGLAWHLVRSFDAYAIIPLFCLGYAAFSTIFELTVNRANVPTLATSAAARCKIADILSHHAAQSGKQDPTIIDLGSGRGQLTRRIARAIPAAHVTGIEIALIPYWQSVITQRLLRIPNASYHRYDFWSCDCSDVDAVVIYLTPMRAQKVGEKLDRELKTGGLVISYAFPLLGVWTPIETIEFWRPFKETIFVYRKGA